MNRVFRGFREFIVRGNAVDLAVGVVIGAAFSEVVTSIVTGVLNPLIAAIFGETDLSGVWNVTIRTFEDGSDPAVISFGLVLNALLQFLLVAAAIYFAIVLPMNALAERRARRKAEVEGDTEKESALSDEVVALHEIRDLLAAGGLSGGSELPVTPRH
ncbi:large conductance mechanosensitive channel [Sediminihabitans luteus]|uniref:Large-conductance mechanosensitive channel n=1 Tax=Sediminihabitans luteus TaxID=1138585 RepID=A0A2M9CE41_9CELL|nr:large conductance mechanosensitive channel protein MscL [Sediminihabitans luteus]PJJ70132.1 large conductance mechanosensitive channel [Sediminihabitans luteus]GIJ00567.1 large conductance mechanosensitive channel protein MscL [Sediminihabitans luteus]